VISILSVQCNHASVYHAGRPQPSTMWKYTCIMTSSFSLSAELYPQTLYVSLSPSPAPTHQAHRAVHPRSSSICFIVLSCLVAQITDGSDLKVCHLILPPHLFRDSDVMSTVISGENVQVPSERMPAGIPRIINVDSGDTGNWPSLSHYPTTL
jgi:hypothetical protein